MIHFTCSYCNKFINGLAIIVDEKHIVHSGCEASFKLEAKCFCGNLVDKTNPDCVEFSLCDEHADDA